MQRGPDQLVITQTLAARESALFALLLAAVSLCALSATIVGLLPKWKHNYEEILFAATLMAAQVALAPFVVNDSWRKTVLTVTPRELTVALWSLLSGKITHRFASDQIAAADVVDSDPIKGRATVAELEIRLWQMPPVRLFGGHPHVTLTDLVNDIRSMLPAPPEPKKVWVNGVLQ